MLPPDPNALRRRPRSIAALIATTPMIAIAVGVYVVGIGYAVALSFTHSRLLPNFERFAGLSNYERLWASSRWLVSVENLVIYALLVSGVGLMLGFVLAACLDRGVRHEAWWRTLFLYPFAASMVVTGLVWQWLLDPNIGLQAALHGLGFAGATFAPLADMDLAIFGVAVAGVWQGTGVTMIVLLAGMRGIDDDIWKATRVDGIPAWRTYLFIALPMLRGAVLTAFVLQAIQVVRVYDLIVAITGGGPGIATEVPAKFVVDHISVRLDVGLGMAAATMLLVPVLLALAVHRLLQARNRTPDVGAAR